VGGGNLPAICESSSGGGAVSDNDGVRPIAGAGRVACAPEEIAAEPRAADRPGERGASHMLEEEEQKERGWSADVGANCCWNEQF
jgi:hypothetical protein